MLLLSMQSMAQTSRLDSIHTLRDVAVVGVRPHYLTPSQTLQGAMLQKAKLKYGDVPYSDRE